MRPTGQIFAGDTIEWNEQWDDYTPDLYTMHFGLVNASTREDFNGVDDGSGGFDFSIAATVAAAIYTAVLYVKLIADTSQVTTLETYGITVLPNVATSATVDGRTQNRKDLDTAYATRSALLAKTEQSRAAFGRMWTYRDLTQLRNMISELEKKVRAEEDNAIIAAGGTIPNRRRILAYNNQGVE